VKIPVTLDPLVIQEIGRIGVERKPCEAVGVLLPFPWRGQRVWEMPNRSKTPHNTFEIHSSDIVITLQEWVDEVTEAEWSNIVLWHTHPDGQVGPSTADLENKIEQCGNLVVALTEDGPVPTWF
jgi:proteasome lid subunit RPN8/RPN11